MGSYKFKLSLETVTFYHGDIILVFIVLYLHVFIEKVFYNFINYHISLHMIFYHISHLKFLESIYCRS